MEQLKFNKTFTVDDQAYADMIKELSQIIGRSYIATFKAFEKLEPHQVSNILVDSEKWHSNGFKSRSMAVWTYRKKTVDNSQITKS